MNKPSIKEVKPELMQRLLDADLELTEDDFAEHATDLYVVAKPGVSEWLKKNYKFYNNITGFHSQEESGWNGAGKHCLDIPFAGNWPKDSTKDTDK